MILPAILLGSWSVHAVTTGNERDFRTEFETVGDSLRRLPILQLKDIDCDFARVSVPADWMSCYVSSSFADNLDNDCSICHIGNSQNDFTRLYRFSYQSTGYSREGITRLLRDAKIISDSATISYDSINREWHTTEYFYEHHSGSTTATRETYVRDSVYLYVLSIQHVSHDSIVPTIHNSWICSGQTRAWPDVDELPAALYDPWTADADITDSLFQGTAIPDSWYISYSGNFGNTFFKYHGYDVALSYSNIHAPDVDDSITAWRITWNHNANPISQADVIPLTAPVLRYFYSIDTKPQYDPITNEWHIETTDLYTGLKRNVHIRRQLFSILILSVLGNNTNRC